MNIYISLQRYPVIKKSQNSINQGFSYLFASKLNDPVSEA